RACCAGVLGSIRPETFVRHTATETYRSTGIPPWVFVWAAPSIDPKFAHMAPRASLAKVSLQGMKVNEGRQLVRGADQNLYRQDERLQSQDHGVNDADCVGGM